MFKKNVKPKIKLFQYKEKPLISKLNTFLNQRTTLIPISSVGNQAKKPSQKSTLAQSLTIYNNKKPSQFLKYKSSKSSKHKANYTATTIKINSLNLSSKTSESVDFEAAMSNLKKDKEQLANTINSQKKFIEKIVRDNEKLEEEINRLREKNNKIYAKYESLKENQNQLILLLKIIEKNGINLEEIIDKWNEQVEENEAELDKSKSSDEEEKMLTEVALNYKNESNTIPANKTSGVINIPKLKFDKIFKNQETTKTKNNYQRNSKSKLIPNNSANN